MTEVNPPPHGVFLPGDRSPSAGGDAEGLALDGGPWAPMTCGFPSSGRAFTRLWRVGTLTPARVLPDTAARAVRFTPELPCQLRVFTQSLLFIRPILRVKSRCRRHFPGLVLEGHAEAGCGQRSGRGQRGLQAERPLLFTGRRPIPAPACGRTSQLGPVRLGGHLSSAASVHPALPETTEVGVPA